MYSQFKIAILFDLPSEDDLRKFNLIKVLLAPLGYKEVIYYEIISKESYFEKNICLNFYRMYSQMDQKFKLLYTWQF